jgi:hypothetical protein
LAGHLASFTQLRIQNTSLETCVRSPLAADGTFSELAGIDPTDWRAAAADLPPVDSHSLVPVLMGTGQSTRKEIPIGTEPRLITLYNHTDQVSTIQGVIQEDAEGKLWKLLIGTFNRTTYP